jgi:hypothetical protein
MNPLLKSTSTFRVPGNSGNSYDARYKIRSRCSHLRREQWEQHSKLVAYLFPLFPGTGEEV